LTEARGFRERGPAEQSKSLGAAQTGKSDEEVAQELELSESGDDPDSEETAEGVGVEAKWAIAGAWETSPDTAALVE
jgi:hypothetical protein